MAEDWIPMREALHEDPAILAMAASLETRPEHVVGYCHRFWAWVSRNTADGRLQNVRVASVEGVLNLPNFCALLIENGWLVVGQDAHGKPYLEIPNFDRWLSQSAKRRAVESRRKRAQRVRKMSRKTSAKCPTENGTTGQDRTGQKRRVRDKRLPTEACGEPTQTPAAPPLVAEAPQQQFIASAFLFEVKPSKGSPGRTWSLPISELERYRSVYGENLNVDRELTKAVEWCHANNGDRKTRAGMLGFLTRWFNRALDAPHHGANGQRNGYDRSDPLGNRAVLERLNAKHEETEHG